MRRIAPVFVCLATFLPPGRAAASLHIAAAADLVYCLQELNARFCRNEPAVELKVTSGSSGNFHAQIANGAPYDVYLSADLNYPRKLIATKHAVAESLTLYAVGRIVLWTMRQDLDLSRGLAVVSDGKVRRFAIGNPEHAPYGRAAREALAAAGVWEAIRGKVVLGENIAQTAQFVQTGNADAGVVALSLVRSPRLKDVGRFVEIPASMHQPLEQGAVITTRGAKNPAAARYLVFLKTPEARTIFDRYGFVLPVSPPH